jgi:hypothetical protein
VLTNAHNSDAQTDAYNAWGGYGGGTTLSGGTLGFVNNAIGGGVVDFTGNATLRWESGNTQSSVPALNMTSRTSFSSERQGMSAASACPPTSPGRRWRCLAIGSILELIARFSLSV